MRRNLYIRLTHYRQRLRNPAVPLYNGQSFIWPLSGPRAADNANSLIIDRYIFGEIIKPMLLGCGLLIIVFVSYSLGVRLAATSGGVVQPATIAYMLFLQTLIVMEILLPTALYFSVVSVIGRLYRESEMAAMRAAGISETRILRSVFFFALLISIIVGVISVYGRPWAYQQTYLLEAEAIVDFNIDQIKAGHFTEFTNSNYVLYTRDVDRKAGKLIDVFLQNDLPGKSKLIVSREARLPPVKLGEARSVVFHNGHAYQLDLRGHHDTTLRFNTLTVHLGEDELQMGYKRKSIPTATLARSIQPKEIAEFQGRVSTSLATLLLALLAVPLGRSAPRQSSHKNFFVAILIYVGFFNLMNVAINWVKNGEVGPVPGVWWVFVVWLVILTVLVAWPYLQLKRHPG